MHDDVIIYWPCSFCQWINFSYIMSVVQLASIADRTILEADKDEDGKISFEEFGKIMAKVDIEQRMSIRFLS